MLNAYLSNLLQSSKVESAAEACVLPHEYLLAEINSFMQHSQNGILHQHSFCCCIDGAWVFFLFYLRFIPSVNHLRNHYAIFSCSKDLPKHTEYRSLNLIPAPINELHDSVTNRFLAPYPSLNPHISHPSLSLCLFVLIVSHASLFPMPGIICTVFLVPSRTTAFLFLQMFSLQKGKKHSTGHPAGLADKR